VIRRRIAAVRRRIANGYLDLAPAAELVAIGQCATGRSILVDVSVPTIGAMLVGGERPTAIPEFADHLAMALAAPHGVGGGLLSRAPIIRVGPRAAVLIKGDSAEII
jgi:hypothetical protein